MFLAHSLYVSFVYPTNTESNGNNFLLLRLIIYSKHFFKRQVSSIGAPSLGVAGYPHVPDFKLLPILSIQVRQFLLLPP